MNPARIQFILPRLALALGLVCVLWLAAQEGQSRLELAQARRIFDSGHALEAAAYLAEKAADSRRPQSFWQAAGWYALQGGDYTQAVTALENAAGLGDLDGEHLLALGDAYAQLGDLDAALLAWQGASSSVSQAEVSKRSLPVYLARGEILPAIQDLQALTQASPSDIDMRYQLGLLLATQDPEAALAHLAQVAKSESAHSGPAGELHRKILSARREAEKAFSLLESGRALASLDYWDYAEEAFLQATRLRPDYADAWALLGEARQHTPDVTREAGLEELELALALDPGSILPHALLAMYWERQGDFEQAASSLQNAIQLEGQNPVLQAQLGKLLALSGEIDAAQAAYRRAAELSPYEDTYQRILASFSLSYNVDVREVALPAARQALIINPGSPQNLDLMGQVLIRLNDCTNARRFLERAVSLDEGYAAAHLNLGVAQALCGDMRSAVEALRQAKRLAPEGPIGEQADRLLEAYVP
jgi:tetratricopeptide (TPR) repeat protein